MSKKITVLSIDGGGIRGIIPATILAYLEKEFNRKMQAQSGSQKQYRIADMFDFVAGTSTGGILGCLYLTPDAQQNPKYSATEIIDFYDKDGQISLTWVFLIESGG